MMSDVFMSISHDWPLYGYLSPILIVIITGGDIMMSTGTIVQSKYIDMTDAVLFHRKESCNITLRTQFQQLRGTTSGSQLRRPHYNQH